MTDRTPKPVGAGDGRILSPNDIAVIRERHTGWEKASPKILADVFGVSVQRITAVLKQAEA
jgi:hypothetical protein